MGNSSGAGSEPAEPGEELGEQIIVCEGCGSKWRLFQHARATVIAELVECPLCELGPREARG